jgi:hypothetical protein
MVQMQNKVHVIYGEQCAATKEGKIGKGSYLNLFSLETEVVFI